MARTTYSPQFKAKLVVEVLSREKELDGINPNMLRGWKREFWDKVSTVFENTDKEARREERRLKKESKQMRKTIGQLTLERDFL